MRLFGDEKQQGKRACGRNECDEDKLGGGGGDGTGWRSWWRELSLALVKPHVMLHPNINISCSFRVQLLRRRFDLVNVSLCLARHAVCVSQLRPFMPWLGVLCSFPQGRRHHADVDTCFLMNNSSRSLTTGKNVNSTATSRCRCTDQVLYCHYQPQ